MDRRNIQSFKKIFRKKNELNVKTHKLKYKKHEKKFKTHTGTKHITNLFLTFECKKNLYHTNNALKMFMPHKIIISSYSKNSYYLRLFYSLFCVYLCIQNNP